MTLLICYILFPNSYYFNYSRLPVDKVQIIVDCRGTGTAMPRSAYLIYLKYAVIPIRYDDVLNIYLMNRQDEAVRWAALPT